MSSKVQELYINAVLKGAVYKMADCWVYQPKAAVFDETQISDKLDIYLQ